MKKLLLVISVITLSTILFSACKKSDNSQGATNGSVQAKWSLDKDISDDYYLNVHNRDTTYGLSTDYIDFRADGKVYSKVDVSLDTSNYQVLSNNKIVLGGPNPLDKDTFDIQTLTSSQFVLHSKQFSGADYYEETVYLKK
ncbi:MAG: hypothetical protein ABIP30_02430 [Ferruginibacter sp.]